MGYATTIADVMLSSLMKSVTTGLVVGMVAAFLHCALYLLKTRLRRGLPPGPCGIPFVGYLPFMSRVGHLQVEQLKQKYGNVFGLYLGSRYVVFLCEFNAMKKALSGTLLLDRPVEFPLRAQPKVESMIAMNGPRWRQQRKFTQTTFKKLGVGTAALEEQIHDELSHLLRELACRNGNPGAPTDILTASISNVLRRLLVGQRLEYDDPKRISMDGLVKVIIPPRSEIAPIHFFTWLRKVLWFFNLGHCKVLKRFLFHREHMSDIAVDVHEPNYQRGVIQNYTDGFLSEMLLEEKNNAFTRKLLIGNIGSFFGGGSGAMRAALESLMLMCATEPHMQRRVQDEIDTVLEKSDMGAHVAWNERGMMPYTQAFIWETLRYRPVIPLTQMRRASEDVTVGDYVIPRGTVVMTCLFSMFRDKTVWGDAEVFRPERFLTDGGTRAMKPDRLVPFSYGLRKCPGESIATMAIFAYFTTILQHFTIVEASERDSLSSRDYSILLLPSNKMQVLIRPRIRRACRDFTDITTGSTG